MKSINIKTTLVAILFIAYIAILLKLLVFKYPGVYFLPEYNFIPFKTIVPYLTGYPTWIVARSNLLGNIVTFIPLGTLLPFLYRRADWKHALAAGFVVSLSIEVLQIVLHAGTFDIDDLLLNTLGTILGYGVFIAAMRMAKANGVRYTWNMKKTWLVAIVTVAVLACGFAVWKLQSPASTTSNTPSVDEKTSLAQLQTDLQNVTPHFIADNEGNGHATLTPEEQKIRDDLVALYAARYAAASPSSPYSSWLLEAQNGIFLNGIGKRYILLTEADVKKARDQILDTQTGTATPVPGGLRFYFAPDRDMALFLDLQAIHTYSLDQATPTLVPGSQLSGTETYHSGYAEGIGADMDPRYTHTKNSITISVFDSSKSVPNPDVPGATMYAKVGQKTLSF